MLTILLALVSSAFWGTGDFIGGAISRRRSTVGVVMLGQAIGGLMLVAAVIATREPVPPLLLPLAGGVVGLVGLLLFYRGLADGKMALVAPVASCGAVIPVVFSVLTGRAPRPLALAGLALALGGVVLVSITSNESASQAHGHEARASRRAAGYAVGAAACFGVFLLVMGQASHASPRSVLWIVLAERIGSVGLLVPVMVVLRGSHPLRGFRPRDLPLIGAGGAMDAAANVTFAYASTTGNLAVVAVLSSLYPLATVGLAQVFYRERVTRLQGGGAALAMLGVVLVSAG